jgi:cytochrome c biogenesis protein CcdA
MTTAPASQHRPDGVTLTAVWFIVGAVFSFLGVAGLLIFALPAVVRDTTGSDQYFAVAAVIFGLLIILVFGALDVAAVVGLFQLRSWGRILAIVLAALGLIWFPIGTAVGALIIWYMFGDEAKEVFGVGRPGAPPGAIEEG